MPGQLGSVIGYPGYTPDQQVLQQRLNQTQQGMPVTAQITPSYVSGGYPAAQAYDYSPSVQPSPAPSPKMSTDGDESGTKKALKARQTQLGQTYPAVDPSE